MPINILNQNVTLAASTAHAKKTAAWRVLLSRNRYTLDLLGDVLALDPSAVEVPADDQPRTLKFHYIGEAKGAVSAAKDFRRIEKLLGCDLTDNYQAENVKVGRITVNIAITVPWSFCGELNAQQEEAA